MFDLSSIFSDVSPFLYAFLGGMLPTLVWLFFWEQEDRKHPEPKALIAITFIGGMIAVGISLFIERIFFEIDPHTIFSADFFGPFLEWVRNLSLSENMSFARVLLIIFYAPIIEEFLKFAITYVIALKSRAVDEPIDPVIYLITAALGFAAVENTLFLIDPLSQGNLSLGVLTGNMRFIGATLLHTVASATAGFFMGFHFYDKKVRKFFFRITGIVAAIAIHMTFNYFMLINNQDSLLVLEGLWVAVIIVLLVFEKVKRVYPKTN